MDLPHSEACERNKAPILSVLEKIVAPGERVLEIGCGTGQHAVHFARHLPVTWLPTDRPGTLEGARMRVAQAGLDNLEPPRTLDVEQEPWPIDACDGVFSANTAHIMGWPQVECMLSGVARLLRPGGWFLLYGPFNYHGAFTSEGNARLDTWARSIDPQSGIRNFERVTEAAARLGLRLVKDHDMPANNRMLEFRTNPSANF